MYLLIDVRVYGFKFQVLSQFIDWQGQWYTTSDPVVSKRKSDCHAPSPALSVSFLKQVLCLVMTQEQNCALNICCVVATCEFIAS